MQEQITAIRAAMAAFDTSTGTVDEFKRQFTGKKGAISELFNSFRSLPKEEKAQFGKLINELKQEGQARLQEVEKQQKAKQKSTGPDDLTLPGDPHFTGARHPLSIIRNRIISIFEKIGFTIADGPEIEKDWYNFTALNMPEDHPARDMQDTFFLPGGKVLRTHTSNIQIRVMEKQKPPIRILAPGMVFRNETVSARAHAFFHQVEGLYVDKDVSFPDMVQVLDYFRQVHVRLPNRGQAAAFFLPLHRNQRGNGRFLYDLWWRRLSGMQAHGLGRDPGLRHGRSQRAEKLRHRSGRIQRIRLWHGHRAHRYAGLRHQRPAPVLAE
jgi:phenylalanyl-tRNA synthetase alpha subunit